jgi:hypothetical protein
MTRKNMGSGATNGARKRAIDTANQVVPMAKNAGMAARQSAEDAAAWAAPRVKEARSWAAPRVEQAGYAVRDKIGPAISEKIAPTVSSALLEAAHRIDDSAPAARRRRWPRVVGAFAMVAAVGSAIAAVMMRRRPDTATYGAEDHATTPDQADEDSSADGHMRSS